MNHYPKPMKLSPIYACTILFLLSLNACHGQVSNVVLPPPDRSHRNAERTPWPESDSLNYVALKDSTKLVHVKNQFYRDKNGRLFDKMYAPKDPIDINAGAIEFFRVTNQDIDPYTFKVIDDSWFAHDKKHVYNYRGNDSGIFCITMKDANVKYFKLMPGDDGGLYGMDNKHVFEESEVIAHIDPVHMQVVTNKEGHMVKIISGRYVYLSGYPKAVLIKDEARYIKSMQGPGQ